MKSATDLINEAKARITQVTAEQAMTMQASDPSVVMLDCREPNEHNLGYVTGSLFIPRGILETNIEAAAGRDRTIVIYCASGTRSALAADSLQQMGYTRVSSMIGGFRGWVEAGGDIEG